MDLAPPPPTQKKKEGMNYILSFVLIWKRILLFVDAHEKFNHILQLQL